MQPSFDIAARKQFVYLLRRLYLGRITNDEFDDAATDLLCRDWTVDQIYAVGAWPSYSDNREYKFTGKDTLTREDKKSVAGWILFLKSDRTYIWPPRPCLPRWFSLIIFFSGVPLAWFLWDWHYSFAGFLLLILFDNLYASGWQLKKAGEITVWPFFTKSDYEQALLNPPYLRGITQA